MKLDFRSYPVVQMKLSLRGRYISAIGIAAAIIAIFAVLSLTLIAWRLTGLVERLATSVTAPTHISVGTNDQD